MGANEKVEAAPHGMGDTEAAEKARPFYPENYWNPEQAAQLSDDELRQAGEAAIYRNVWSPLAKATLSEVFNRWLAGVSTNPTEDTDPAQSYFDRAEKMFPSLKAHIEVLRSAALASNPRTAEDTREADQPKLTREQLMDALRMLPRGMSIRLTEEALALLDSSAVSPVTETEPKEGDRG